MPYDNISLLFIMLQIYGWALASFGSTFLRYRQANFFGIAKSDTQPMHGKFVIFEKTQSVCPFHPITGVKYVRFVGCNRSFLVPPYTPYFFPQHTIYLPANSEGISYSAIRTTPTAYPSYQLLSSEWLLLQPPPLVTQE
jgi:hypothetical protein